MEKNYDHKQEEKIISAWEKSGVFAAPTKDDAKAAGKKPFTIIMPPPNANDPLHVGHAMFVTIEDILIRYHRMMGDAALWLPGTDHAGIETQFVFEKKLAKQGKSRYDFDRKTLYQMIADYVDENSGVAINQMKRLGASADWTRFKFTLDKDIVDQVTDTFIKLYKDGLVYKGVRLVNYCTRCGTGYSELEVEHEEREDKLYFINYGPLTVATTRPETMLGDVAVAVNPKDKRFKSLLGQEVDLPLSDRKIKIIADEMVDMEFGTGAVKVTPSHDSADWEIAERQGWDVMKMAKEFQVIGQNGKMTETAGKYAGLSIVLAREAIVTDLKNKLTETKPLTHSVGICYRCHRVIEPLPMSQFFIKVRGMADKAIEAIDKGEIKVHGVGRDKILRQWLVNLKDWNISRQIVWGIRLPVWNKGEEFKVSKTSPGEEWTQETDTFDTWFSSGQWPVITLKTNKPGDFEYFYPTGVMETAYDILPFWVMRMLMLGIYMTGKVPFKEVYFHGLVRDEQGRKMSKSIGNVVNPMVLVEKYGADALRMALVMSTTPGNDSNVGESKVRGMRNLANKIWNAARYVKEGSTWEESRVRATIPGETFAGPPSEEIFASDEEFRKKLDLVTEDVTRQLEDLKIGLAAETVYNEFWHWYCDAAIETNKKGDIGSAALKDGLAVFLKLLHPFVPFVTEAVWKEVFPNEGLLAASSWPKMK